MIEHGSFGSVPLKILTHLTSDQQLVYMWAFALQNLNPYPPSLDEISKVSKFSGDKVLEVCEELIKKGLLSANFTQPVSEDRRVLMKKPTRKQRAKKGQRVTWISAYADLYNQKQIGVFPYARYARPLRQLETEYGREVTLAAWERYLNQTDKQFVSVHQFARNFGAYKPKDYTPTNIVTEGDTPGW